LKKQSQFEMSKIELKLLYQKRLWAISDNYKSRKAKPNKANFTALNAGMGA